jgi:two-component system phosphate regulon sensor histidine kinase PhoR
MYAETLEMGRIRGVEKKRQYYGTIVRETERLTRLVNNLLNFSRMEAGRKPYNLLPLDMNALVSGVLETFGPHFSGEGFTPVVELDREVPAVRADAEAVQEALINILDNAVKYSGGEKYLRVATGKGKDGVTVEIEDHGEGISREYREKIFETFFRIPASHAGGAKGSGLGLAIARHIMDAHGGTIDVRSEPGTGSTFTLTFRYDNTPRH